MDRLFHVNICVRDMERSIRFYEQIGFNKVNDFTAEDPRIGDGLGVKASFVCFKDPDGAILELISGV